MIDYRLYLLGPDGHFSKSISLAAENDEDAKQEAKKMIDGTGAELWNRARLVVTFPAKRKT